MSKDIPKIDDLTRGINDSELILTEDTAGTQVEQKENNNASTGKGYCCFPFGYRMLGVTSWNTCTSDDSNNGQNRKARLQTRP